VVTNAGRCHCNHVLKQPKAEGKQLPGARPGAAPLLEGRRSAQRLEVGATILAPLTDLETDAETPRVCTGVKSSQAVSRPGNHSYTQNNKWSDFRRVNLLLHPLKVLMVSWGPQFAVNWCKSGALSELMEIRCARS